MFYENKQENLAKYDKVFLEACNYANKIKQTISELGKSEETAMVFFSDHGTGIGERFGERNYGVFTYEETIRTHYLFIGPNIQKGKICDKLFSSTRIFHTLLDICEVESEEVNQEKSLKNYLLGYLKEVNEDEYTFSETGGLQGPFPSPKEPNVFCIKTKNHKLIYFKTPEEWKLFDLQKDPNEVNNIFGEGLDIEKVLQEKLLNWINR